MTKIIPSPEGKRSSSHVLVIPFPASGHILPHLDLTNQLALRGLTITVLVTPKNLHFVNPLVSLHPTTIQTLVLPFPNSHPSIIPPGVENMQDVTIEFMPCIATTLSGLHDPIVHWFQSHPCPPVAIFCDALLNPWTHRLASALGIKLIGFMPVNANFVFNCLDVQLDYDAYFKQVILKTKDNWGLVFNSFAELEKDKFDVIKAFMKHDRVWGLGPSIHIKAGLERSGGGPTDDKVMAWLDLCQLDKSVVYVGFGSQITLNKQQMEALGDALEKSGVRFLWAVKDPVKGVKNEDDQSIVPAGFEDRVAGRGLVIRGWVPQAMILKHRAVGSYLSHCGWGSVLEGLIGGVLLLAWPMQCDHFLNTNMLVDDLGVAIRICEGLSTVPNTDVVAQILTESVNENLPERIAFMKLRKKALNAIEEASGGVFSEIGIFLLVAYDKYNISEY
ncbi:hypothetical protein LWI28_026558 [Acer negundo]|uniref:Uncharacterized protein n=1 Tax=Acer negundo TaxID=4023 RepID=A0AAD5P3A1_ACENE|nr:hypothetical protein LWI28_026558 [Acer negundo]